MSDRRSISLMTGLNVVGAIVGLASSVLVARFFGVSRQIEIYFAAIGVQNSVVLLMQTGQLNEAFLPKYHRIRNDFGQEAAFRAFSIILNWLLIGVMAIGLIAFVWATPLMRLRVPGFSAEDILTASKLFQSTLPLIGIQVTNNMLTSLCNAEKLFGKPEAISVGTKVISIIGIVVLVPTWGVWGMVGALWMGIGFGFIALLITIYRSIQYRHRFVLSMDNFNASSIFINLIYTLGYTIVTQFYSFALDAALSSFRPGIYAVVRYVQQLYSKSSGIFLRPVSTVYFTKFSEGLSEGVAGLRDLSQKALRQTLFICSFVIVIAITAGRPGLEFLWGSARFPPEDIKYAAILLSLMFAFSMVQGWAIISRKTAVSVGLLKSVYGFGMATNCTSALICVFILPNIHETLAPLIIVGAPLIMQIFSAAPLLLWKREYTVFYENTLLFCWIVITASTIAIVLGIAIWCGAFQSLDSRLNSFGVATSCCVASAGLLFWFANLAGISEAVVITSNLRKRLWFKHG